MQTKTLTDGIKKKKRVNKDVFFYSALLILPLLQICVFYFGVNFQSIMMAFQHYRATPTPGSFEWGMGSTLERFKQEINLNNGMLWPMIGNSVTVWIITSLVGTSLAVLFAYYVYKKNVGSNFFKLILFLPSVLPGILLVVLFKWFIGDGAPTYMERLFSVEMANVLEKGSRARFWTISLFSIWISFGPQVLVYTGAMDQISPEILEAGQIDGAAPMREFISIIVPCILPTLGTFLTTGVASLFTNQNNLFNFVEGFMADTRESERTIGYYLYCLVYEDSAMGAYCYAAFLGLLCTLVVVPLALGIRKAVERMQE